MEAGKTAIPTENEVRNFIYKVAQHALADISGQKNFTADVTPQMAEALLTYYPFERQRRLKPNQIKVLKAAIATGELIQNNAVAICVYRNAEGHQVHEIVNAYHTLHAVMQSTSIKSVRLLFILHPVADKDEVARMYSKYDSGTPRSQPDINRAIRPSLNLTEQEVNSSTSALSFVNNNLEHDRGTSTKLDKILAVRDEWRPQVVLFHNTFRDIRRIKDGDRAAIAREFYRTVVGAAFQAPFLTALLAQPAETVAVQQQLVELCKKRVPRHKTDAQRALLNLYEFIMSEEAHIYGHNRRRVVWKTAVLLRAALDADPNPSPYEGDGSDIWDILTEGRVPRRATPTVEVDMAAAQKIRQHKTDAEESTNIRK